MMIVLLYMYECYEVRFKFAPPLYNCITVGMLFNIVGHKIGQQLWGIEIYGAKRGRAVLPQVL